jgi:VanZ family protein
LTLSWASLLEATQRFVPDRESDPADLLANAIGVLVALAVGSWWAPPPPESS